MDIDKDLVAKQFGRVLKEIRANKNISQEELAIEVEMARSFLSELERGIKQPSLATLFAIAKTLGVKPSYVVSKVEKYIK